MVAVMRWHGTMAAAIAVLLAFAGDATAKSPHWKTVREGCVPCHGDDGIARDSEVPNLAGQNELYLANQMRAFRSGARVHPEMAYMMHDVDDATISALAAYFADLSPPR